MTRHSPAGSPAVPPGGSRPKPAQTGGPTDAADASPQPMSAPQMIDLESILGPAALLPGDDRTLYDRLTGRLMAAVQPHDMIEAIWVRDVADSVWESHRLRRYRRDILQSSRPAGLERLLKGYHYGDTAEALAAAFARGQAKAAAEVRKLLEREGLGDEAIAAHGFVACLDEVERIDALIDRAEARTSTVLREVERRREAMARRLRVAVAAEDADFVDLTASLPSP